jgi:hypothetical protein
LALLSAAQGCAENELYQRNQQFASGFDQIFNLVRNSLKTAVPVFSIFRANNPPFVVYSGGKTG